MKIDEDYADWKPGDKLLWTDVYYKNGECIVNTYEPEAGDIITIKEVYHMYGYVYWTDLSGNEASTRCTNLMRITDYDTENYLRLERQPCSSEYGPSYIVVPRSS